MASAASTTRVLIAGGGVAALEALLAPRDLAGERVAVELLSPRPRLEYRPLAVAEPFGIGRARSYELEPIARDQGATLRHGALAEVRPAERQVITREGEALGYDALLVAIGAKPDIGLPGAITIKGPRYTGRFRAMLEELEDGRIHRLVFAVPPGASWPLPLYELALLTARHGAKHGREDLELVLVTPEAEPLELFGAKAAAAARELLEQRGIELVTGRYAAAVEEDGLHLVPPDPPLLAADRVVSLPRLHGPRIPGLTADDEGFIPTDLHGRVVGAENVYAAGDATAFPIEQGGIAAQQADAAAEAIAAAAGAEVDPRPFRPVLRGMPAHGRGAALHARRDIRRPRREHGRRRERALVAAQQDRRPLPLALPRGASRRVRERGRRRPGRGGATGELGAGGAPAGDNLPAVGGPAS